MTKTTKFCCFRNLEDINKEQVRKRIIKQCDKLQVSKLPLVAFFWSNYDVKRYVDAMPSALEKMYTMQNT